MVAYEDIADLRRECSGTLRQRGVQAMTTAALLVDCRCVLGEGLLWDERRRALLWADIQGAVLWMHWIDDESTLHWKLPDRLGAIALGASGKVLLGLAKGLFLADVDGSLGTGLQLEKLVDVEPDNPDTRINDCGTDRSGNFVFGTLHEDHTTPAGSFYQYSTHHGLRRLDLGGVAIPNSICFSIDGKTLYYCDSSLRRIMQCRYDSPSAAVADIRRFTDLGPDQGTPDGSIIDAEGFLWNAEWGAAAVRRYAPDGRIDRSVGLSARNPTSVALGGDGFGVLYITSARKEMTPEDLSRTPEAGGVYRAPLSGVRGLPEERFQDVRL